MSHKAAKTAFRKQYFQLSTGIKEDIKTLNGILYSEELISESTRDKADANETLKAIEGRLKIEEGTFQAFISALEKITNGDLLVKKLRSCYEQELPTSGSTASASHASASAADVGGTLGESQSQSSTTHSHSMHTHTHTHWSTLLFYTGIADLFKVNQCLKEVVRWKDLGLALGLLYPTLKKIETTQREDVNKCMQEMLAAWLSQQDAVAKVGTPSWETLKAALKSIGENMLADSINS